MVKTSLKKGICVLLMLIAITSPRFSTNVLSCMKYGLGDVFRLFFPRTVFCVFGCNVQLGVVPDTKFEIFVFLCLSR